MTVRSRLLYAAPSIRAAAGGRANCIVTGSVMTVGVLAPESLKTIHVQMQLH